MAGLEETLALDYAEALSGVDELESKLTGAAQTAEAAFSAAFTSALGDAEAFAQLSGEALTEALQGAFDGLSGAASSVDAGTVDVAVSVDDSQVAEAVDTVDELISGDQAAAIDLVVDTSSIDDAAEALDSLSDTAPSVDVTVDSSEVDDAADAIDLLGGTIDATITVGGDDLTEVEDELSLLAAVPDPEVAVQVDTSQVEAAAEEVAGLSATAEVSVDSTGGQGLDQLASSTQTVAEGADDATGALAATSVAASVATGGIGGLSAGAGKLIPAWGAAAAAGAGLVAVTKNLFDTAVAVDAANRRLTQAYGDQAEALQDLSAVAPNLPDSIDTLKELTLATGSSGAGLKTQIANYAELGKQSGATTAQLVETGQQFGLLANYVAAARPELGTADQIAGQLSLTLARGGPRAAKFGIDIGNSAAIAEAAAEKYGKPVEELSAWEKSTTGLGIALENLGPQIGANLEANLDNPVVKMRMLDRELRGVLATAAEPLLDPLLGALEALQPVVLSTATLFGTFAGSVIPAAVEGVTPLLEALGGLAELLAKIPAPAVAAGAAFIGVSKGAGALLPLILRIGPALSSLSARLGAFGTSLKLDNIVAQFRGAEKAVGSLTTKIAAAGAANTAYASALSTEIAAGNTAATAALVAHTAAVEADTAVLAANATVNEANLRVRAAEAAVARGATGSEAELAAARQAQTAALANLARAEQTAAIARTESTVASELAVASAESNAAELAVLSGAVQANATATASAAGTVTAAGAAAGGAATFLGPLAIILGIGAAAWALWSSSQKDATEGLEEAQTTLSEYTESLGLTNEQLSNLDGSTARREFEQSGKAADDFFAKLEEIGQAEVFNDLGLNLGDFGDALSGVEAAAEDARAALLEAGEVELKPPATAGEFTAKELEELREQYVATGEAYIESASGAKIYVDSQSDLAEAFEEQLAAAEAATDAVKEQAQAEVAAFLESGEAADVNAAAQLAATGQLRLLGEEGEVSARIMLEQADAQQLAADTAVAYQVAAGGATDATGLLIEAAQRAAEAFAQGDALNTSDLGAARALAASDAFDDLPPEVQDSITALLDFADAEVEAADDADVLITSLGEVSTSLVDLRDELDAAIDKFDELRGAQGRYNAGQRDIASGIRGIDDQVIELGASLDDQGAAFDAASITADNYRDYLALLSDEQRKAIQDAKVPDGTNEDGTVKERDLTDEEAAIRVRDAIVGSADAMGRANDEAKDNADNLLDYFDTVTSKIAEEGEAALARGNSVADVNAQVAEQTKQFRDAAIAAGVAADEVDAYLATVGLNPVTGFSTEDLDTSGVSGLITDLQRLTTVISFLPKETQIAIEAETDPEKQRQLIEDSLQQLGPAFNVQVDTYLAATTPEEATAALAAIQQTMDRLQIVKVALGLEVDPNADPGEQLRQIQEQIGDKTVGAQVAIQTYLQAPDPVAAQFALDSIVNRAAAAKAVVAVAPQFSEEEAAQAVLDITKFNNDPANAIKLPVTVETATLVAQVNSAYEGQLEAIDVRTDISEDEKQKLRDELEGQRTTDLKVIADTGQANADVDALTAEAQEQEVNVNVKVPEWAKWIVGYPGAEPPARSLTIGESTGIPILNTGGQKPKPKPGARRGSSGGSTVVDAYAEGGARVDPRILRRLQEQDAQLEPTRAPTPGLYGAGSYVTFAEDGTAGEYLISRSATDRERNQGLVRTAAADLGVSLAPQVSVQAPQVAVSAPGTDPALLAALDQLAAAQGAPQRPGRTLQIAPGAIVVNDRSGDSYRTAAATADEFASEAWRMGDV